MTVVLVGGGGLLGSGVRTVLERRGTAVRAVRPDWSSPASVAAQVRAEVRSALEEGATTVAWAAGVGHVGADATAMLAETAGLAGLTEAVEGSARPDAVRLLFASSAGALFGGVGRDVVDEATAPLPVSAYGRVKLEHEEELRRLAERTGCRVVLARISNLYGLASGRVTARGLVSTAVRATRLRSPMTVYVEADTRRDYVFSTDAAALALAALRRAGRGCTTTLVRDGSTRTVGEVLAVVGAVAGRRVPATYAERPATRLQPRVLRFAPPERGPSAVRRTPMEAAVHLMLRAPLSG